MIVSFKNNLISILDNSNENLIKLGDKAFGGKNWDSANYYYSLEILMCSHVRPISSIKELNDLYFKREWSIANNLAEMQEHNRLQESSSFFKSALFHDTSSFQVELKSTFEAFYRKAKKELAHKQSGISDFFYAHAEIFLKELNIPNLIFTSEYAAFKRSEQNTEIESEAKSNSNYGHKKEAD